MIPSIIISFYIHFYLWELVHSTYIDVPSKIAIDYSYTVMRVRINIIYIAKCSFAKSLAVIDRGAEFARASLQILGAFRPSYHRERGHPYRSSCYRDQQRCNVGSTAMLRPVLIMLLYLIKVNIVPHYSTIWYIACVVCISCYYNYISFIKYYHIVINLSIILRYHVVVYYLLSCSTSNTIWNYRNSNRHQPTSALLAKGRII